MKNKTLLSIVALMVAFVFNVRAADIQNGKVSGLPLGVEATILTYTPSSAIKLKTFTVTAFPSVGFTQGSGTVKFKVGGVVKYETVIYGPEKVTIGFGDGLQFSGTEALSVTVTPITVSGTAYTSSLFFQ